MGSSREGQTYESIKWKEKQEGQVESHIVFGIKCLGSACCQGLSEDVENSAHPTVFQHVSGFFVSISTRFT